MIKKRNPYALIAKQKKAGAHVSKYKERKTSLIEFDFDESDYMSDYIKGIDFICTTCGINNNICEKAKKFFFILENLRFDFSDVFIHMTVKEQDSFAITFYHNNYELMVKIEEKQTAFYWNEELVEKIEIDYNNPPQPFFDFLRRIMRNLLDASNKFRQL